jgi:hypothetical protein
MNDTPRRIRRNTKGLDALKAAAIIIVMLIGCILILWLLTQLLRNEDTGPEPAPQPAQSMW